MKEARNSLGLGLVAVLPIVCCIGIPALAAAAGASVALAAWVGGIALVGIALAAAALALVLRAATPAQTAALPPGRAEWLVSNGDCRAPIPARGRGLSEEPAASGRGPLVEILYFDGCPNHEPALALVERLSRELGLEPELRLVKVPDQEAARRLRFLGSPTIRVGGVDVDPSAPERADYALSCRVFQTEAGLAGQPEERWVREALRREAGAVS